jgi:hypothetical protein
MCAVKEETSKFDRWSKLNSTVIEQQTGDVKCIDWVFVAEKKNLSSGTQCDRQFIATSSQCSTVTMLWEPQ